MGLLILDIVEHTHHILPLSLLFTQLCPPLWEPVDCSTPGFPVLHHLPELAHTDVHWVSDIQLSHPLSPLCLLPSVFPSIRVFSNELAVRIRWPEYWSFSFTISPSNEYSGLTYISARYEVLFENGQFTSMARGTCGHSTLSTGS